MKYHLTITLNDEKKVSVIIKERQILEEFLYGIDQINKMEGCQNKWGYIVLVDNTNESSVYDKKSIN